MSLAPPPRSIHRPSILLASASAMVVLLLAGGCNRTIEEDEPRELVESRIEPCRQYCTAFVSLECGARPEDRPEWSEGECVEACAAAEPGGWEWGRQENGTDACAPQWLALADCIDALTCEEQHTLFTNVALTNPEYSCKEEFAARSRCFRSTPSLDRGDE